MLHLKQLFKIYYFHEEIDKLIKSSHKVVNNINNNKIYLINKKILNIYKTILEFESLSKFFEKKDNNISINYKNIEDSFSKLISELDKDYLNRIKNIDILKEFKLNKNDYNFNIKYYEIPYKPKLPYIIDFDIIDEEIFLFLLDNSILKEDLCYEGNCIIGDGKIFLIFKGNYNNYYEIGHFDSYHNFIIEYLIQENYYFSSKNDIIDNFNQKGI